MLKRLNLGKTLGLLGPHLYDGVGTGYMRNSMMNSAPAVRVSHNGRLIATRFAAFASLLQNLAYRVVIVTGKVIL